MGGQNSKMLNFEPIRHMRGLFASFSGAELDGNVKTLIFGVFGGQGVISGTPGVAMGVKIQKCSILSLLGI